MLILAGVIILFAFFVSPTLGLAVAALFACLLIVGEWLRLRAVRGFGLQFERDGRILKDAAAPVKLSVTQAKRFAGSEYTLKIVCENVTSGETETFTVNDLLGTGRRDYYFRSDTSLAGLEVWTATLVRARSLTAMPALGRRETVKPVAAERLILPDLEKKAIPAAQFYSGETPAARRTLKQGNDPSELYGIREWMPGDSVKQIHQKLTAKYDRLLIGEWAEAELQRFDIGVDPNGYTAATPEQRVGLLTSVMSQIESLADYGYQVYLHIPEYGMWMQIAYSRHDDSVALWRKLAGIYTEAHIPPRPAKIDILWFDLANMSEGGAA